MDRIKKEISGFFIFYTANEHDLAFLNPHPNPPPPGEGVYEKFRISCSS
jgi:hypothetical protein